MKTISSFLLAALLTSSASAQFITGTGVPAGDTSFIPSGMSPDGAFIIGTASGGLAYRWSAASGFQLLETAPGSILQPHAINTEGAVISGTYYGPTGFRIFRWTPSGGLQILPLLPGGTFMWGYGMSGDGLTIVGEGNDGTSMYKATRWTAAGGVRSLTNFAGVISDSNAWATNFDGSIIIGQTYIGGTGGGYRAFRWTSAGMTNLGTLPGFNHSKAFCISSDGAVIAGTSSLNWIDTPIHPVLWTVAGGIRDLGLPEGMTEAQPSCISADGSALGILARNGDPRAAYWSAATGVVDLNTYLPSIGVNLDGWILTRTYGISADGRTLTGEGGGAGHTGAWIVSLGCLVAPTITTQPLPQTACPSATATFTVAAAGTSPFTYQWQWQAEGSTSWSTVLEGNNLNTLGEPVFTAQYADARSIDIHDMRTVNQTGALHALRAIASNPCGSTPSNPAALTISMADFNCDGTLDLFDYLDFVAAFSASEPGADYNHDGIVDFFDYLDFIQAFSAGG